MVLKSSLVFLSLCSMLYAGGRCNSFVCRQKVVAVQTVQAVPVISHGYHSVGANLYNQSVNEQQVQRFEKILAEALARVMSKQHVQQGMAPADPSSFAARYPAVTANCISCHGDAPKGNELSFTRMFNEQGELSCEVRMKAIQELDSGRMPKGKNLSAQSIEPIFNELLYGGKQ